LFSFISFDFSASTAIFSIRPPLCLNPFFVQLCPQFLNPFCHIGFTAQKRKFLCRDASVKYKPTALFAVF
jgi:hypothetical protein